MSKISLGEMRKQEKSELLTPSVCRAFHLIIWLPCGGAYLTLQVEIHPTSKQLLGEQWV